MCRGAKERCITRIRPHHPRHCFRRWICASYTFTPSSSSSTASRNRPRPLIRPHTKPLVMSSTQQQQQYHKIELSSEPYADHSSNPDSDMQYADTEGLLNSRQKLSQRGRSKCHPLVYAIISFFALALAFMLGGAAGSRYMPSTNPDKTCASYTNSYCELHGIDQPLPKLTCSSTGHKGCRHQIFDYPFQRILDACERIPPTSWT